MSNNHKQFGGLLIALFAVAAIGCSSDSSPSGPGGGGPTKEFSSGTLNQNASFEHVFMKAATYHYFCSFHGTSTTGMHGTITVGAAGTANKFQSNITASTLADFTIEIGDTIRWTNLTTMAHNVQSAE